MTAHWKHGNGFSIRYGGRGQIAWFFSEGVAAVASQARGVLHPARLVLDAVDAAAAVGLWWETRKQTAVMTAEFEERRLLWCADLMAVLSDEVASGQAFRADTTHMLECASAGCQFERTTPRKLRP